MHKEPYPYCPHGKYVGGCGIDWICGACEMGDELTPEEQRQYEARIREWDRQSAESQFASLPPHILDGP